MGFLHQNNSHMHNFSKTYVAVQMSEVRQFAVSKPAVLGRALTADNNGSRSHLSPGGCVCRNCCFRSPTMMSLPLVSIRLANLVLSLVALMLRTDYSPSVVLPFVLLPCDFLSFLRSSVLNYAAPACWHNDHHLHSNCSWYHPVRSQGPLEVEIEFQCSRQNCFRQAQLGLHFAL